MTDKAKSTRTDDSGATLIEYGLLVALVAVVAIGALQFLGGNSRDTFAATAAAFSVPDDVGHPGGPGPGPGPGDGGGDGGGDEPPAEEPEGDDGLITTDPDAPEAVRSVSAAPAGSEIYWWDSHGGRGEWAAAVTYTNDSNRHSYLDLEVTRVRSDGTVETYTVNSHYVPAGGSSNVVAWSNGLSTVPGETSVTEVSVRVVGVRTSDENWQTVHYPVNGEPTVVSAPPPPG